MTAPLTARGVKIMLGRAGVDYSGLVIRDEHAVWIDVETGERSQGSVVIEGPRDARKAAFWVLFDKGLSIAPYSKYDVWSRPRHPGAAPRAGRALR